MKGQEDKQMDRPNHNSSINIINYERWIDLLTNDVLNEGIIINYIIVWMDRLVDK